MLDSPSSGIQATYRVLMKRRFFVVSGFSRQRLQKEIQPLLYLLQRAEGGFFKVPTCTSEVYGAPLASKLTGDESGQLANLEDTAGCVVVDHRSSRRAAQVSQIRRLGSSRRNIPFHRPTSDVEAAR